MTRDEIIEACARAAHEANRAYCIAIGDKSQASWEDTPEEVRQTTIDVVSPALSGATPEQLHELWCAAKYRDGWSHGPHKDSDLKTHPCLVSYNKLPIEQRRKDALYQSVVNAMGDALAGPLR
jgi:hypothetical protein